MIVGVGEAGQSQRVVVADELAQLLHVDVGLPVAALVGGFGVDDDAVGAGVGGLRRHLRLPARVLAVDEGPGADLDPAFVQRADQLRAELAPAVDAVGALDVDDVEIVALRLAGDAVRRAAGGGYVPDPGAVAVERRGCSRSASARRRRRRPPRPRAAALSQRRPSVRRLDLVPTSPSTFRRVRRSSPRRGVAAVVLAVVRAFVAGVVGRLVISLPASSAAPDRSCRRRRRRRSRCHRRCVVLVAAARHCAAADGEQPCRDQCCGA